MKIPLWGHQRKMLDRAAGRPYYGIYFGAGGGKTLATIALLIQEGCKLILVCCKPRTIISDNVWEKVLQYIPDDVPYSFLVLNHSGGEKKAKVLRKFLQETPATNMRIVVISHMSVWRDIIGDAILNTNWDAIVVDEAHRIKAAGSEISLFFTKIRRVHPLARRYALTGSPMHNSPLDVYGLYRFLNPQYFGTNFGKFRDRYAYTHTNQYGIPIVTGFKDNIHEIRDVLASTGYLVASDDVLDLPDEHHVSRYCHLDPTTRKLYDTFRKELYYELENGAVISTHNILTRLTKLQQIASGHLRDDDGNLLELNSGKEELLIDVLEDMPSYLSVDSVTSIKIPVVIFYRYIHDAEAIKRACKAANFRAVTLDDLSEWKVGNADALAVQVDSGSEAIELTRASVAIYWSKSFSYGSLEQSIARLRRPDETDAHKYRPDYKRTQITCIHLLAVKTIDEQLEQALSRKEDIITTIYREIHDKQGEGNE